MKNKIESVERRLSESSVYLFFVGLTVAVLTAIKSAVIFLWRKIYYILAATAFIGLLLTIICLEGGAFSVWLSLILFIVLTVLIVLCFRSIVLEVLLSAYLSDDEDKFDYKIIGEEKG